METRQKYLLKTGKEPCTVEIRLTTDGTQVPVYIVGYDPYTPNSFYFQSLFLISGAETISLNCPQSPRRLVVEIWSEDKYSYQIASLKLLSLSRPEPDNIIGFIERFARAEGVLRPGYFTADNVPFKIELRWMIFAEDGSEHPTPARIHVSKPIIQVSKRKFDNMSIPERVIILLHEVSHNFINANQDDELESDQNGLNIYNQLGYPKIEAVNAFATIMADTDENYQRMQNLLSM